MALHPGEQGVCPRHGVFDEYCSACADENRKRLPLIRQIEIADLPDLVKEAKQSCRCDGGCTDCGACRAEKRLREAGYDVSASGLQALEAKLKLWPGLGASTGRFSAAHPNQANTPRAAVPVRVVDENEQPTCVQVRWRDSWHTIVSGISGNAAASIAESIQLAMEEYRRG